jgi:hypothetical protein
MHVQNRAIGVLRALAHPERLALLAAIGPDPVGIGALAQRLGVPVPALAKQLGRLESAGLVRIEQGTITPTLETMAGLANELEQALPITSVVQEHGLERFFKHGLLDQLPVDAATQAKLADALVELIPRESTLTEADVNRILGTVSPDHATLRRLLVDHGVLTRGAGVDYRRA